MKTGDLARLFGVSDNTIRTWTTTFPDFFSESARAVRSKQRSYTEEDVLVLATIAKLSTDNFPHSLIQEKLESGYRLDHPGEANFGVDTRMVPAAAVEQIIDATEIRIELEQIKSERDRLLQILEDEQSDKENLRQEIKSLQAEIKDLQRELGRAEGELSFRRELEKRQRNNPDED